MATLQKIRNRAGLFIAVFVGVALLAFIVDPQTFQNMTNGSQTDVAEIDGVEISYEEMAGRIEYLTDIQKKMYNTSSMDENQIKQIRTQVWEEIKREQIVGEEYDALGISVGEDELFDLVQGGQLHPIIGQLFGDPQTGQVNRSNILNFLKSVDEDPTGKSKEIWMYIESTILREQAYSKYLTLIAKGLTTTDFEANDEYVTSNTSANVSYFVKPFSAISDSSITVTDADLQAYYNEHKEEYKTEPSRNIEYVTFDIKPSEDDFKYTEKLITDLKEDFIATKDYSAFVDKESDENYDGKNYKDGALPLEYNAFMFDAEVGDAYGPYLSGDSYIMAVLAAENMMPDSVKASHILIDGRTNSPDKVKQLTDSIKTVIDNGGSFADLAREFSADQGSAVRGGDLGWFQEGTMVPEFNDACFTGKKGDVVVANTDFGSHIIKIEAQGKPSKKVQVATLVKNVVPSEKTRNMIYSKVAQFASASTTYEIFNAQIAEQKLTKKVANNIQKLAENIAGVEAPRDFIQAIYRSELNAPVMDRSNLPIFDFNEQFVVAFVTKALEKGYTPIKDLNIELTLAVKKQKKSEKLISDIQANITDGASLAQIAAKSGATVVTADNVQFNSYAIPGLGIEPLFAATAVSQEVQAISKPFAGNNGVYVIQTNEILAADETDNYDVEKATLARALNSRVYYEVAKALENKSEIVDNRADFY